MMCLFFAQGCASVVIDEFKHNLGIIAGIIIFIGLIQVCEQKIINNYITGTERMGQLYRIISYKDTVPRTQN